MPFERHTPLACRTSFRTGDGRLVLAAMPTLTSPLAKFAADGVRGCAERVQARLFFGLHRPAGTVSEPEWETFLADVVTARFPDGLTVFRSHGQWRGSRRPAGAGAVARGGDRSRRLGGRERSNRRDREDLQGALPAGIRAGDRGTRAEVCF